MTGETSPAITGTYVVIANPLAGRGRGADALRTVTEALQAEGIPMESLETAGPGEAVRLAREAARSEGVAAVVAVGGDGTLHEVVNGLLLARTDEPPTLGVVPVGTGNDYAKMLGVPGRDPAEAARILIAGKSRLVDAGRLDGTDRGPPEFFCNNVGMAFLAAANAGHERHRHMPGRLSYVLGGLLAFIGFRAELLTVTVDGTSVQGRFMLAHVGIGRFCGGGVDLTPHARIDDGEFAVYLATERGKVTGLLHWSRLSKGERLNDTAVLQGKRVRVAGPRGFLIHADGEVRTVPSGVLELTLLPGAIRVVYAE